MKSTDANCRHHHHRQRGQGRQLDLQADALLTHRRGDASGTQTQKVTAAAGELATANFTFEVQNKEIPV
jgi:hypothetical protein